MIINGKALLNAAPIKDMFATKERNHGVSHGLAEAGYDIRIKQEIRFTRTSKGNPMIEVNDANGQILETHHGRFTLASSIEEFQMPNDLVGVVHDKSTWIRKGLSVFNTVIEPGWNGFLTLEMAYHGQEDLHIPAGAGIAQILFHETIVAGQYNGKYQNQSDRPVAAIYEKG